MNKHTHCHCPHTTVKYCSCCDLAYCVDCNKEWVVRSHWYTPSYTYPYTYTTGTSAGTCVTDSGSVTSGIVNVTNSSCNHGSHGPTKA